MDINPVATLVVAGAALAAVLGSTPMLSFDVRDPVAVLSADPVIMTFGGAQETARVLAHQAAGVRGSGLHGAGAKGLLRGQVDDAAGRSVEPPAAAPPVAISLTGYRDETVSPDPALEQIPGEARFAGPASPAAPSLSTASLSLADGPATPSAGEEGHAAPAAPPGSDASTGSPPALAAFVGVQYTSDEVRELALKAGWAPELLDDLVRVAWCESRFQPAARGRLALGLMQVMPFWFRVAGEDLARWSDPVTNLRVALVAFNDDLQAGREPWAAWQCLPVGEVYAARN